MCIGVGARPAVGFGAMALDIRNTRLPSPEVFEPRAQPIRTDLPCQILPKTAKC